MILIEIETVTAESARVADRIEALTVEREKIEETIGALTHYQNALLTAKYLHHALDTADADKARAALAPEVPA